MLIVAKCSDMERSVTKVVSQVDVFDSTVVEYCFKCFNSIPSLNVSRAGIVNITITLEIDLVDADSCVKQ